MLKVRYVEAIQHDDGRVSYKRPFYAKWDFPTLEQVVLLRELGYRFVTADLSMRQSYYARPWPLWAMLRLWRRCLDGHWGILAWLYRHGVFHFRTPEGVCKRWRDLGLGPNPQRRKSDGPAS